MPAVVDRAAGWLPSFTLAIANLKGYAAICPVFSGDTLIGDQATLDAVAKLTVLVGIDAFVACRLVTVRRGLGPTNVGPTARPPLQPGIRRRPCSINYLSRGLGVNGGALRMTGKSLNGPCRWHRKPLSAGPVNVMIDNSYHVKCWGHLRANLAPHPRRPPMATALGRGPSGAWRAGWCRASGRKG